MRGLTVIAENKKFTDASDPYIAAYLTLLNSNIIISSIRVNVFIYLFAKFNIWYHQISSFIPLLFFIDPKLHTLLLLDSFILH